MLNYTCNFVQNQIDKQQKCRMLVKRILKFLFNLADYNEFYDQIVDLSRFVIYLYSCFVKLHKFRSFNNPALLLPMLNNVELEFNLMKLLFKLSQSRALISFWANSPEICNIFERFRCSNELTISSYAKRILTQMKQLGNCYLQNCYRVNFVLYNFY